jgi:tetratricopeptide (TPR) repeat protein
MKVTVATLIILYVSIVAAGQGAIRGQMLLPNGAPLQRTTRFNLTYDNGTRNEILYSDSNGRIVLPPINTPFTITIDTDGEAYDTTRVSFIPPHSGNYVIISLRPLKSAASSPPGTVDANTVDGRVSEKAKVEYDAAITLMKSGQYKEAVDSLRRAIALQPDYYIARNDLGVAYLKLGNLHLAERTLREAIKINDKPYIAPLNLGIVLNERHAYKEATEVLLRLQHRNPDLTKIHAPLIEALMETQQWPQAEAEIKKALAVSDANLVGLKTKMGMVELRLGKYDQAAIVSREVIAIDPDNALAHFSLGAALLESGKLADAERPLRRAYEIKGSAMPGVQFLLGQLYFRKKDYQKSLDSFETYLRELPGAPNASQVREAIVKLKEVIHK